MVHIYIYRYRWWYYPTLAPTVHGNTVPSVQISTSLRIQPKSQNPNFFARFRRCERFSCLDLLILFFFDFWVFGFLDRWVFGFWICGFGEFLVFWILRISGSVALWLCGYLGTQKWISACRRGGVSAYVHIYIVYVYIVYVYIVYVHIVYVYTIYIYIVCVYIYSVCK